MSKRKLLDMPLQKKNWLIGAVAALAGIMLVLMISRGVLQVMREVEGSYASNRTLASVQSVLEEIQGDVTDFLSTRSMTALEQYYEHVETYRELLRSLNSGYSADEGLMMEKNIHAMSESYLAISEEAIWAKRGRNIEAYQEAYTELTTQYKYLTALIYTLSSSQLRVNAESYGDILQTGRLMVRTSWILLLFLALLDVVLVIVTNRMSESSAREKTIMFESQAREAELKFLRAQINPHFLFNTLNAGAQLAMMEEAEGTYQYLHKVAAFYRYTASQERLETDIRREIELIDDFMYIINVRYGGEIIYEKHLPEELPPCRVPGMILQPIVENCVRHGLAEMEGEKRLTLTAEVQKDTLSIIIEDNGAGMAEEIIRRILEGQEISSGEDGMGGVGLSNVLKRLRMFYHQEQVMDIVSAGAGKGTAFHLLLPLNTQEDGHV